MNPNYIEDFNGSDYVCMTRAVPQSASKFAPMTTTSTLSAIAPPPPKKNLATSSPTSNNSPKHQSTGSLPNDTTSMIKIVHPPPPLPQSLATSNENIPSSNDLGAPRYYMGDTFNQHAPPSVSPTPSQLSTGSNKRKRIFTSNFC